MIYDDINIKVFQSRYLTSINQIEPEFVEISYGENVIFEPRI